MGAVVRMLCEAGQAYETKVEFLDGYSPSLRGPCVSVTAHNVREGVKSEIVSRSYPEDCTPVPEPPIAFALCFLFVVLLIIAEERKR